MKHVPNAISLFRLIAIGPLLFIARLENNPLPFIRDNPVPFVILFVIIGATDALDGFLARKYHVESEFGAKLDNAADTLVFIVGFVSLVFLRRPKFDGTLRCVAVLLLGVALKVFSFTLTRVRFGSWNSMHTYTNKALGVVMFLAVPTFFWLGKISFPAALVVAGMMALTVAEDTYILLTSETYRVDHKGLIAERLAKRKAEGGAS